MQLDLWVLYREMFRSRLFEEAVTKLWEDGLISGEMHLGTGEEAIIAGVVSQLQPGDALALDHRPTAAMLMHGVDPVLLLREFLGHPGGLCRGMGGHMHLFSRQHLAASSGIVGSSGPAAAGFALAADYLRPGTLAVAFFGEGAANQGMLLEALNLAVVWKLPVLFVCKDNQWEITTPASLAVGSDLAARAEGFGMPGGRVDGRDVEAVWQAARKAIERARNGGGPTFLHATCTHLEGHMLGDPLLRINRHPVRELAPRAGPMIRALFARRGAPPGERIQGVKTILSIILSARKQLSTQDDPLVYARRRLAADESRLLALEAEVEQDIRRVVDVALQPV